MAHSFQEHTADVRMNVEGKSFPSLFRHALLGLFEYMRPVTLPSRVERSITVRSTDTPALLVDFLNETLSLAQANKEAYDSVQFLSLHPNILRAKIRGRNVSSFGKDIKAVTYHEANVWRDEKGVWHGHVLCDV